MKSEKKTHCYAVEYREVNQEKMVTMHIAYSKKLSTSLVLMCRMLIESPQELGIKCITCIKMGVGNKNWGGMAIILRFALLDHIFPPVE